MMKNSILLLALLAFTFSEAQITTGEINFVTGYSAEIEIDNTNVTLTLMGAEDRYLAIGFGVSSMTSGGDIVSFDDTGFNDRQFLGIGATPTTDTQDWTVVSNDVNAGIRTLIATRPLAGSDATDFTFDPNATSLDLVWARGTGLGFVNHGGDRGNTTVGFTLGVDGNTVAQSITLFPVPANDIITLSLRNFDLQDAKAIVYSLNGNQVITQDLDHKSAVLDISALASGMYVIHVESETSYITSKFIKL